METISSIRNKTMKDQRVVGKRKNNPVAQQLSDPMWRKRVVKSKAVYNTSHSCLVHADDGSPRQRSSLE